MAYATLSRYKVFRNLSKNVVIPGWWVVEYSLHWYFEVDILGEMMFSMLNNGSTKHFPSAWLMTSNIQQNSAHYPICTFHIHSPEKDL